MAFFYPSSVSSDVFLRRIRGSGGSPFGIHTSVAPESGPVVRRPPSSQFKGLRAINRHFFFFYPRYLQNVFAHLHSDNTAVQCTRLAWLWKDTAPVLTDNRLTLDYAAIPAYSRITVPEQSRSHEPLSRRLSSHSRTSDIQSQLILKTLAPFLESKTSCSS